MRFDSTHQASGAPLKEAEDRIKAWVERRIEMSKPHPSGKPRGNYGDTISELALENGEDIVELNLSDLRLVLNL